VNKTEENVLSFCSFQLYLGKSGERKTVSVTGHFILVCEGNCCEYACNHGHRLATYIGRTCTSVHTTSDTSHLHGPGVSVVSPGLHINS
jgi:hypothetical protein